MTEHILYVHGGNPLQGEVNVRGAKNLVSKAMVAALLGHQQSRLRNVPDIVDVRIATGLLEAHGVSVRVGNEPGERLLDPSKVEQAAVAGGEAQAGPSRRRILLCGPRLHRLGQAFSPD